MRGGAFRVGKESMAKCARLVRQGKQANEINRFFPEHWPCFLRPALAWLVFAEF